MRAVIQTTAGFTLEAIPMQQADYQGFYRITHHNGVKVDSRHQDVLKLMQDGGFIDAAYRTPTYWAGKVVH